MMTSLVTNNSHSQNNNPPSIYQQARENMLKIKVQTYFWDIFDPTEIAFCKAMHSEVLKTSSDGSDEAKKLTAAIDLSLLYKDTDLGYLVDKSLSYRISTKFMDAAIQNIEKETEEELKRIQDRPATNIDRPKYFDNINVAFDKRYYSQPLEAVVEFKFMGRVTDRLFKQEDKKLFKDLELPRFSSDVNDTAVKLAIEESGSHFASDRCRDYFTEDDHLKLDTYARTFHTERLKRVLTILKDAWEKDKAAREIDPNAPLNHIVTLDHYETQIYEKRKWLYTKTAVGLTAAVALFFLQQSVSLFGWVGKEAKRHVLIGLLFWKRVNPSK